MWGLFGHAVVAGDVDGDGREDLVISAPGAGSYPSLATPPNDRGDLSSQGAVYVFLQKSFDSLFRHPGSNAAPSADHPLLPVTLVAPSVADYVLQRPESFQYFGRSLIIVPATTSATAATDSSTDSSTDTTATAPMLLVGAPMFHSTIPGEQDSAVGAVFAYQFCRHCSSRGHTVPPNDEVIDIDNSKTPGWKERILGKESESVLATRDYSWSITGCSHAARFGQMLAFSPALSVIAIAQPAFNGTHTVKGTPILRSGRVILLPMHEISRAVALIGRDLLISNFNLNFKGGETSDGSFWAAEISGDATEGRFGSSLAFVSSAVSLEPSSEGKASSAQKPTTSVFYSHFGYFVHFLVSNLPTFSGGSPFYASIRSFMPKYFQGNVLNILFSSTSSDGLTRRAERDSHYVNDRLVIGAPLAASGAGTAVGFTVSRFGCARIVVQKDWCVVGSEASRESLGRFGHSLVVDSVMSTPTSTSAISSSSDQERFQYSVLVGSPWANGGAFAEHTAPDNDQYGMVHRVSVSSM